MERGPEDNVMIRRKRVEISTKEKLWNQIVAMREYANAKGMAIPPGTTTQLDGLPKAEADVANAAYQELVPVHAALAQCVAPATPEALDYLRRASTSMRARVLGPVPLVQVLMGAAMLL